MDKFCQLLEKILKAREDDSQISDDEDEDSYVRTDVEKEMRNVNVGIEKQKAVEQISERQRIKRGKVSLVWLKFIVVWSFLCAINGGLCW